MNDWKKNKYGYYYIYKDGKVQLKIMPHNTTGWEIKIDEKIILCYDPIESIVANNTHPSIILDEDDMKLLNEFRDEWNAQQLMMEMSGELERVMMSITEAHLKDFFNTHNLENIYKVPTS